MAVFGVNLIIHPDLPEGMDPMEDAHINQLYQHFTDAGIEVRFWALADIKEELDAQDSEYWGRLRVLRTDLFLECLLLIVSFLEGDVTLLSCVTELNINKTINVVRDHQKSSSEPLVMETSKLPHFVLIASHERCPGVASMLTDRAGEAIPNLQPKPQGSTPATGCASIERFELYGRLE
jgi:hypothetical protein